MSLFIVAEISANHNGSIERALRLIQSAKDSGASAVKFQTYKPDSMVLNDYLIPDGPWKGRSLRDLYKEAQTPWGWHQRLFDCARNLGLVPFSTPFDSEAVDFLESLNCKIYKIASFEITDLELIRKVSHTNRPVILSTGMSFKEEIKKATETAIFSGCRDLTLLKCTSAYPAPPSDANLKTLEDMKQFGFKVGISDHTLGIGVSVAAVALGAVVIEKHLTLSRSDGGPDSGFSMEPDEFKTLVTEANRAYESLGTVRYGPTESEKSSLKYRRSLYFNADLPKGTLINKEHIKSARPALGLSSDKLEEIIGKRLEHDVRRGDTV